MSELDSKTSLKNKITLKLIDSTEGFIALEKQWNELYEKSVRSTIFSSWDWMITWWEVYKDQFKRKLFILCLYREKELVGIAPFQTDINYPKSLIQGKTLRFIGAGEATADAITTENLDFIVLPEIEEEMVSIVSDYLAQNRHQWNFADFEFLLKDALILKCFSTSDHGITKQEMKYGVRFFVPELENLEDYLSSMGKRWSKMFRKKMRAISRAGEYTIESSDDLGEESLALLAEMHCSRWKAKTGSCIFESSRFYEFHQKILKRLLPQNRAWIRTLKLEGEALASYYVFTDKNRIHYYQSGFSSKYANKYSPLFLLVCNEVGSAIENNKHFDFMYADSLDSYKKEQYATETEDMYRLKWTPQAFRFKLFALSKAIMIKFTKESDC